MYLKHNSLSLNPIRDLLSLQVRVQMSYSPIGFKIGDISRGEWVLFRVMDKAVIGYKRRSRLACPSTASTPAFLIDKMEV